MKSQNRLLAIAKEFIGNYVLSFEGILGAILVGSASFGVYDEFVDLDVIVYADDEVVKRRKAKGKGYNETYQFKGVEICVDWNSIRKLEEVVSSWKNDESLWVYHNTKILYDPQGLIKKLLSGIERYPDELRREMIFLHFYYLKAFLESCEKAILRDDPLTATFLIYKAVDELSYLAFILDGSYVPYPKWRFYSMKRLPLGRRLLPEIGKILFAKKLDKKELTAKIEKLNRILESLKPNITEAGIPMEWLSSEWWKHEPKWYV